MSAILAVANWLNSSAIEAEVALSACEAVAGTLSATEAVSAFSANDAVANCDKASAIEALVALSANDAVAAGLNVVALAATDAESIVSVTTK